jgi:Mn2+/Fe2+ NRAMP family transporter
VKGFFAVALGILAAVGGFVDIGDLVFTTQAGGVFGYQLIWAVVVGVVGIVVFAEMSGRVATVTGRPVMDIVRQRLGFGLGLLTLIGSVLLTVLTLAAEVGGVGLVLELFFDVPYSTVVLIGVLALIAGAWALPFESLERVFGYLGLGLLVYVVGAIDLSPDWSAAGEGLVPHVATHDVALYAYFAVGLIAAALTPYEVYFYSSGAVEERWKAHKDLGLNRLNAVLGFGLGAVMSIGLIVVAAQVWHPLGVQPELIGTTALGADVSLGEVGLILALIGIVFAVGGAAIDTAFSAAYNVAQFFGWEWGKYRSSARAPRFTISWLLAFAIGYIVISTGVDPVQLTEYAVVFSVVVLPLTYFPVLLVARDKTFMGQYANGRVATALGWFYLVVIVVVALAAIPLLIATNAGGG